MPTVFELLGDAPADTPVAAPSSFDAGLRSGFTSLHGQAAALMAGGAEAIGANDFAAKGNMLSRQLQEQAAAEAPKGEFKDINSLRSGVDWAAGKLGQFVPAGAAMTGAMLLTRGRVHPGLAAMGTMLPMETATQLQEQQNDPVIAARPANERLPVALQTGLASSAVQSVVPGLMGGKLLAPVAGATRAGMGRVLATNMGEAVAGNAAAGAGSDLMHQGAANLLNPDRAYDPHRTLEAAATGGVLGAPFGLVGAAGEALHARPASAGPGGATLVERAKEAAQERFSGLFNREGTKDAATARAVAGDKPLERMPEGADPLEFIKKNDATATQWATDKLSGWLAAADLAPETRAKYEELLSKVGDHAARAEVGTIELARQARDQAGKLYEAVAGGEALGAAKAKLQTAAKAVGDYAQSFASKPISQRVTETQASIAELLKNPNLTDEAKAKLQQAAQSIGDAATQAWVASVKKVGELGDDLKAGYADARESMDKGMPGSEWLARGMEAWKNATTKKSEDYSGARAVISQEMLPALQKHRPEALSDPKTVDMLADVMRAYVKQVDEGKTPDAAALRRLREFFGEDTVPLMEKIAAAVNGDAGVSDNMYAHMTKAHEAFRGEDAMHKLVVDNLADKTGITRNDVREATRMLRSYVDGSLLHGKTPERMNYITTALKAELDKTFGKNADKVLKAFEKDYESRKETTELQKDKPVEVDDDADIEAAKDSVRGDTREQSLEKVEPDLEPTKFYGGKGKTLMLSHAAHVREFGNQESQAKRVLAAVKEKHPDRNVSFMSARDYARERGIPEQEMHELTGGKLDDYGIVAVEGERLYGRITPDEARQMLLESKNYSRSKSRIDTDKPGITLDAYKITKQTMARMEYIDGESNARRTARAFKEGLASALVAFDARVKDIPDSTVIAMRNGEAMTYKDVKTLRSRDPKMDTRDLDSDIMDVSRQLTKAKKARDNAKVADLQQQLAELKARQFGRDSAEPGNKPYSTDDGMVYRGGKEDSSTDIEAIKNAKGVYEIAPDDQIHLVAAANEKTPSAMEHHEMLDKAGNRLQQEREALVREAGNKKLADVEVTAKLYDKDGNELTWKGAEGEHPGRMTAEAAMKDIYERRTKLRALLACLKG